MTTSTHGSLMGRNENEMMMMMAVQLKRNFRKGKERTGKDRIGKDEFYSM